MKPPAGLVALAQLGNPNMNWHFQRIIPACTLSFTGLCEAARIIGPSFVYTLHVSETEQLSANHEVRKWMAIYKDNPLSPQINVVEDQRLTGSAWVLTCYRDGKHHMAGCEAI